MNKQANSSKKKKKKKKERNVHFFLTLTKMNMGHFINCAQRRLGKYIVPISDMTLPLDSSGTTLSVLRISGGWDKA